MRLARARRSAGRVDGRRLRPYRREPMSRIRRTIADKCPLGQDDSARHELRRRRCYRVGRLRKACPRPSSARPSNSRLMPFAMKAVALPSAASVAQRQSRRGKRGDRLQAIRQHRRGGRYAAGARRAGVRNADRLGILHLLAALTLLAARARGRVRRRRTSRRHVHDQQSRRSRRDLQYADHQPPRGGHSAARPFALAAGGPRR